MKILMNPRFPKEEAEELKRELVPLKDHVWIATSGSTSLKWTALSYEALNASAGAVNKLLESDKNDVWLNVLPFFHVGGLGIITRAQLSGAQVLNLDKWDPYAFYQAVQNATLTALVPTNLYDLVLHKLSPRPLCGQ